MFKAIYAMMVVFLEIWLQQNREFYGEANGNGDDDEYDEARSNGEDEEDDDLEEMLAEVERKTLNRVMRKFDVTTVIRGLTLCVSCGLHIVIVYDNNIQ